MTPLCLCSEEWACPACAKCTMHCECALMEPPVHTKSKDFATARARILRARNQPVPDAAA
jgi:hypothetical protein